MKWTTPVIMVFCKHVRFSWCFQYAGRCNLFYCTLPKWKLSRRFTTALKKGNSKEAEHTATETPASRWISFGSLKEIHFACLPYETLETTNLLICNPVLHTWTHQYTALTQKYLPLKRYSRDFIIRARSLSCCWIHTSNPADYEQLIISQSIECFIRVGAFSAHLHMCCVDETNNWLVMLLLLCDAHTTQSEAHTTQSELTVL